MQATWKISKLLEIILFYPRNIFGIEKHDIARRWWREILK